MSEQTPNGAAAAELAASAEHGLQLIGVRIARTPDAPFYNSIRAQFAFIRERLETGGRFTDAEKQRVILGVLAVREFEDTDPELADVMEAVNYGLDRL